MNKLSRGGLVLILILILINVAVARPPFSDSEVTIGFPDQLDIIKPNIVHYIRSSSEINTTIRLNFFVFNSTGYHLDGTEAECTLTLFDQNGGQRTQTILDYNSTSNYHYTTLTCDRFIPVYYQSVIYCNSSTESGFATYGFSVSNIGETIDNNSVALSLVFIMFIIFMLGGLWAFNRTKNKYYKLIFGNLSTLMTMIVVRLTGWFIELSFPVATALHNNMTIYYSWGVRLFSFGLLVSTILLLFFIVQDFLWHRKQKESKQWSQWNK